MRTSFCKVMALVLAAVTSFRPCFAVDLQDEENAVELESATAESRSSSSQAAIFRQRLQQSRAATQNRLNTTAQYVRNANSERARAEAEILRSEREIQALHAEQHKAMESRQRAEQALTATRVKLAKVVGELNEGKTILQTTQAASAQRARDLEKVNSEIANAGSEVFRIKQALARQREQEKELSRESAHLRSELQKVAILKKKQSQREPASTQPPMVTQLLKAQGVAWDSEN